MRKILILLLLLSTHFAMGQFWIGPKVGFQGYTTTFKFDEAKDSYKNHPRLGYTFGGAISANLKPAFAIAAELQYSRKGKHTEIKGGGYHNIASYHFLEGPIMLRYIFEEFYYEGITMKPYLEVGPNFSYWMSGKGVVKTDDSRGIAYKISFDESDTLSLDKMTIIGANRFMWGLEIGGGVMIDVKQGQTVLIDLRFHLGNTFFSKNKDGAHYNVLGFSDNLEQHYRTLNLSVTYFFEYDWHKSRQGKSTVKRRKRR